MTTHLTEVPLDLPDGSQELATVRVTLDRYGDHEGKVLGLTTADGTLTVLGTRALPDETVNRLANDAIETVLTDLDRNTPTEPDWDWINDERDFDDYDWS